MSMHIRDWNALRDHGIDLLTGEACSYSMRGLCDLTEEGKDTLEAFFGIQIKSRPWNSKGVASIMLAYAILEPLATFIAFRAGYEFVVVNDNGISAYNQADLDQYGRTIETVVGIYNGRLYRNYSNPKVSVGGRNVHQMSGRVE